MFSHSISIAFHKQHNPPLHPPHKARSTAPHFPHITFRYSLPRSSSKHWRPAVSHSVSQWSAKWTAIWCQTVTDFVPLASGSKPQVKALYGSVLKWILQVELYWVLQWVTVGGRPRDGRLETGSRYCSTAALQNASEAELDSQYSDVSKQLSV